MQTNKTMPAFGPEGHFNRWWVVLTTALALAVLMIFAAACTVVPVTPHSTQASYDGNRQNSGLIAFQADGSAVLTAHAHDRYTNLLANYGSRLQLPPKYPEEGMFATNGTFPGYGTNVPVWIMDGQHLNYFKEMNRWRKAPPGAATGPPK